MYVVRMYVVRSMSWWCLSYIIVIIHTYQALDYQYLLVASTSKPGSQENVSLFVEIGFRRTLGYQVG